MFRPAFGCAQHPKAGRNTQQMAPTLFKLKIILTKYFSELAHFGPFGSNPFLKTCPNLHHSQGALKFATQISPLLNCIFGVWKNNFIFSSEYLLQSQHGQNEIAKICESGSGTYSFFNKMLPKIVRLRYIQFFKQNVTKIRVSTILTLTEITPTNILSGKSLTWVLK